MREPGVDLRSALRRALREHPHWRYERPSWIALSLWAHDYTSVKPTRQEVGAELAISLGLSFTSGSEASKHRAELRKGVA